MPFIKQLLRVAEMAIKALDFYFYKNFIFRIRSSDAEHW